MVSPVGVDVQGEDTRLRVSEAINPGPTLRATTVPLTKTSVKRLASIGGINAILPGDGWPVFIDGDKVLSELVELI